MYTGKNIKELRNKFGIKQIDFAKKLDTTVYNIRYWEQHPKIEIKSKYHENIQDLINENTYISNYKEVEKGLPGKIKSTKHLFLEFIDDVMAIWYCVKDKNTPLKFKIMIYAALAYFIIPIDAIPDMLPIVGFTDDAAMIVGAVAALGTELTDKHKKEVKNWRKKNP